MFKHKQLFALLLSTLLVGNLSVTVGHSDFCSVSSFPLVALAADIHSITVNQQANGSATSSVSSAAAGSSVAITVTPNGGYSSGGIAVADSHNNAISTTKVSAKEYSFTMPDSNVTVIPIFLDGATGTSSASVSADSNSSNAEIPASSNSDITPNSTVASHSSDSCSSSASRSDSHTSQSSDSVLDGLAEPTQTIVVASDGSTTVSDKSTSNSSTDGSITTASSGTVIEESNISSGSSDSGATTANGAILVPSGGSAMSNDSVATASDAIIVSSGGNVLSGGGVTTANDGIIVSSGGNRMSNSGVVVANDGVIVSSSGVNPSSENGIVVASDGIVIQDGGLMGVNGSLIDNSSPSTAFASPSDSSSANVAPSGSPKILSSVTENEKGWSWVSDSKTVPNAQNSIGEMTIHDSVRAGEGEQEPTVKKEVVVPTKMISVSVPLYLPIQTDAKGNIIVPSKAKIVSDVKKGKLCVDSITVHFSSNGKATETDRLSDSSFSGRLSLRKDDMDSSGELDLSYTNWLLAPQKSLALNIKVDDSEGSLLSETTAMPAFVFDWAD